jgi:heme-degrading monooxygenase HmoA
MPSQLAQFNIARLLFPFGHPGIAEFADAFEHINLLAERSPGFVWRWKGGSDENPWSADPLTLVNMSVWETPRDLKNFVYHSTHVEFYRKRSQWFEKPSQHHYVLWWVHEDHVPSLLEAKDRLDYYRNNGASPHAFSFTSLYSGGVAIV